MYHPALDALIAVAECGSFNKASERLYISPTAVMKQITVLERMVGLKLIERTRRGAVLTPAGRSIYEDARFMVRTAEQAVERARQIGQIQPHVVRIGSSQLYPVSNAIALWDAVSASLSHLTVSIIPFHESGTGDYLRHLGQRYDLIYSAFDADEELRNVSCHALKTDQTPFCIAVSKNHSLAGRTRLSPEDLNGYSVMMMEPGHSPANDQVRQRIAQSSPGTHIIDTANFYDMDLFNRCAERHGMMLSLNLWKNIHPALVHIPLDVPETISCGFLYADVPSPETQEFLDAVQKLVCSS